MDNFFDDWKVEGIMKQDSSLRNITFVKKKEKNETEFKTMRNLGNIHQREFLKNIFTSKVSSFRELFHAYP